MKLDNYDSRYFSQAGNATRADVVFDPWTMFAPGACREVRVLAWDFQISNGADIITALAGLWVGWTRCVPSQVTDQTMPPLEDLASRLCLRNFRAVSQFSMESTDGWKGGWVVPQGQGERFLPSFRVEQPALVTFNWRVGVLMGWRDASPSLGEREAGFGV